MQAKQASDGHMLIEATEIASFLEVGNTGTFHTGPAAKEALKFRTAFRGWREGNHILLDRPRSSDGKMALLKEKLPCVIRFLSEGRACAMNSIVLDWDSRSDQPAMRIAWPKSIHYVGLRRTERVNVNIKCTVDWGNNLPTLETISDMSAGGCGVRCKRKTELGQALELGFELPGGQVMHGIRTEVRHIRETDNDFILGVSFLSGQPQVENEIRYFVNQLLGVATASGNGAAATASPADAASSQAVPASMMAASFKPNPRRILIFENDEKMRGRFKRNFDRIECESFFPKDALDGLGGLRMAAPGAIVIRQDYGTVSGMEIAHIIRSVPDFATIPLYVYGGQGDTNGLDEVGRQIGITMYFSPRMTMAPDISAEIAKIIPGVEEKKSA
jgi:c-di-GMP-binding flagellar brake protein YcgR